MQIEPGILGSGIGDRAVVDVDADTMSFGCAGRDERKRVSGTATAVQYLTGLTRQQIEQWKIARVPVYFFSAICQVIIDRINGNGMKLLKGPTSKNEETAQSQKG